MLFLSFIPSPLLLLRIYRLVPSLMWLDEKFSTGEFRCLRDAPAMLQKE